MTEKIKKIVLAYSGGLDTSVMLRWLREEYGCEVVCYCADVGQGEELAGLEEKARATGASKLYVEDLRREFAVELVRFGTPQPAERVKVRECFGARLVNVPRQPQSNRNRFAGRDIELVMRGRFRSEVRRIEDACRAVGPSRTGGWRRRVG